MGVEHCRQNSFARSILQFAIIREDVERKSDGINCSINWQFYQIINERRSCRPSLSEQIVSQVEIDKFVPLSDCL
ncbi:hypothetical protein YQ44_14380 [Janthinobacterium sp. 1_2014MBL_MicDiv]|nr:hypothetical protein YQ44_14380 [Janthinobacterium sp. 1_2014MBL_MicDiv]